MTAAMADWEGLDHDLLVLILKKINLIDDFATFCMVCKSWNAVAATNKQYLRCPQTPWLMLPVTEDEAERRNFSLSKQDRLTKTLYIQGMSNTKCFGLNYGWFLIKSEGGDTINMNLVHPLSQAQIQLPPLQTMTKRFLSDVYVNKAALSANPSESPSDFVLMIICGYEEDLRYWRPWDERWTNAGTYSGFSDLTYHQDRFYAITRTGEIWRWTDLGPHQDPIPFRLLCGMDWRSTPFDWTERNIARSAPHPFCKMDRRSTPLHWRDQYVVAGCASRPVRRMDGRSSPFLWTERYVVAGSTTGSLLVLLCNREITREAIFKRKDQDGFGVKYLNMWFQMFELDLRNGEYTEIKSLGDRAIFVGRSTSVALENASEYPGVKPSHIYFTNNSSYRWEKEVGCYNLHNGQTSHFSVDVSLGRPFWFIPAL